MPKKNKILIVEDDQELTKMIKFRLKQEGYDVREANDGVQMFRELKDCPPDLILLDIMMPYMDGYSAVKELRQMEKFSNLPIIIITAKEKQKIRDLFIFEDIACILEKPFELEELLKNMKIILKNE